MEYVDYVYDILKKELDGFDAIYEDYILNVVGFAGFHSLVKAKLLETCGVVNGRQLYVIVDKK